MSLLVDHKYGKRKIGNLKTRKSEIKAYRWLYGNGHRSGLIYLSHVNAHQKVTTMESILGRAKTSIEPVKYLGSKNTRRQSLFSVTLH